MVGDNYYDDVFNSQQVGMEAIWIKNPATMHRYTLKREPENKVTIEEFTVLPAIIARM
jgi:FMN phosphatase YigB (HAD superfamily)